MSVQLSEKKNHTFTKRGKFRHTLFLTRVLNYEFNWKT